MVTNVESNRVAARAVGRIAYKRSTPPLRDGDCMSQPEFHRRYLKMPDVHAELIGGVVYMSSPEYKLHSRPLGLLGCWLGHYEIRTLGVETYPSASLILDDKNELKPDLALCISPLHGGRGSVSDKMFFAPAELVIDVANTSQKKDLGVKKTAFETHNGVEYLVHCVQEIGSVTPEDVYWFVLRNGVFVRMEPDAEGILRSTVFPGLWLDTRALMKRNLRGMLRTLAKGLKSSEHAAFRKTLRSCEKEALVLPLPLENPLKCSTTKPTPAKKAGRSCAKSTSTS